MKINLEENQVGILKTSDFARIIQKKLIELEYYERILTEVNNIDEYSKCGVEVLNIVTSQKEDIIKGLNDITKIIGCLFENVYAYGCYSLEYGKIMFEIWIYYSCKEEPQIRNKQIIQICPKNICERTVQEEIKEENTTNCINNAIDTDIDTDLPF